MTLLDPYNLDAEELAYRIFGVTRDKTPWRAADHIREVGLARDPVRLELAWRTASRGYYAEQAGLVAAATLAASTDDAPLRLSLAVATADEARHADAFYQYARAVNVELEPCQSPVRALDETLAQLPHMGRMLVHTILEGVAADEFILLSEVFTDDALGRIYHHVRRDEVQHIAIGLNYLARVTATAAGRDEFEAYGDEWQTVGLFLSRLEHIAEWLAPLTNRDTQTVKRWFVRRHRARIRAARLGLLEGG